MEEKYYLTEERLAELKVELDELKTKARIEVAEHLKRAKEYGDLSENAEYAEAKEEQSRVEQRIFELEEMVKRAVIISEGQGGDTVTVGSIVTIKKDGKSSSYTIVGSNESKPEEGKISNESPLGRAFLGHKVGDKVEVNTPSGKATYEITKIA
jgi:transcription elongation factor GreA